MSDTRPPLSAANRRSYFREASMEEYTPANSINEASFREGRWGNLWLWVNGPGKVVLRLLHAALHLGVCMVLLAITVEFLVRYRGHRRRPQAIALTSLVAADSLLDIYSVIRLKKKWQGWAMALRLLLAMGYIAQFFVYVGFRQVFPPHYTYWGMSEGYSEPVVYILLVVLGIWDLLHTAIHRHALGRDLRQCVVCIQALVTRPSQADDGVHSDRRRAPSRGRRPGTSTSTQLGEASASDVTIALREVHVDDKGPSVVGAGPAGASLPFGEPSSHGGSTVYTKSETGSAITSKRTSATTSDDETPDADGPPDGSTSIGGKV